jgi:hypothetical protein
VVDFKYFLGFRVGPEVAKISRRGVIVKKLIASFVFLAAILAGGSAFAGQVSIGIQIGAPPRPRVVHVVPRRPGPEFVWVEGYWYPQGRHYRWQDGYWTRPPYPGAYWIAPRYDGRMFYQGSWERSRGRFDRDDRFDRDRDRGNRDRDRNNRDRDRDNRSRDSRGRDRDRWDRR